MSKAYEDLNESEKLLQTVHFPSKTGPNLTALLESIQHQMDKLILYAASITRDTFQVSTGLSDNLDKTAAILDVVRFTGESDEEFRTRILGTVSTFETVTVDSILNIYEVLLGKRPTIWESFSTKVYQSGESSEDLGGSFNVTFEVPITMRSEPLRVASGGTSVIASDDTIITPYTTAVSETTSVANETFTTTLYVDSSANFPDWGELFIENEWIRYGSKQTSPHAFLNCIRGVYDSIPASHATDIPITEGSTKVFLEGTNQNVYSSQTDQTIFIIGGPYDWDTYFNVQYKIANEYEEEFDTTEELLAAIDQLKVIGYDFKAAGINAKIEAGPLLTSWFQNSSEGLIIIDSLSLGADQIHFLDFFVWDAIPDTVVFYEADWDDAVWDAAIWVDAWWNGEAWEQGTKGWYNLVISGST